MQIKDIEIHADEGDFAYKALRRLEAKVEASTALSAAPSIDEANAKLRELAISIGANAIINVEYKSGVSLTSWKSMKATGLAVIRESDEIPCPDCAETIKRAAKRCRYCGAEVTAPVEHESAVSQPQRMIDDEPLRGTNNPQMFMIIAVCAAVLFMLIAIGSN